MDSKMSLKEISPEPVIIEMLDVFLSIRNRICKKPKSNFDNKLEQ